MPPQAHVQRPRRNRFSHQSEAVALSRPTSGTPAKSSTTSRCPSWSAVAIGAVRIGFKTDLVGRAAWPPSATATSCSYWSGRPAIRDYGRQRAAWFNKNPEADAEIRSRFRALHQWGWARCWTPGTKTRFPVSARSWSRSVSRARFTDEPPRLHRFEGSALHWPKRAVAIKRRPAAASAEGFHLFAFEHAEDLQPRIAQCLFRPLAAESTEFAGFADYARRHREVIARFGRFPTATPHQQRRCGLLRATRQRFLVNSWRSLDQARDRSHAHLAVARRRASGTDQVAPALWGRTTFSGFSQAQLSDQRIVQASPDGIPGPVAPA